MNTYIVYMYFFRILSVWKKLSQVKTDMEVSSCSPEKDEKADSR
jgi:hypothetical protein